MSPLFLKMFGNPSRQVPRTADDFALFEKLNRNGGMKGFPSGTLNEWATNPNLYTEEHPYGYEGVFNNVAPVLKPDNPNTFGTELMKMLPLMDDDQLKKFLKYLNTTNDAVDFPRGNK